MLLNLPTRLKAIASCTLLGITGLAANAPHAATTYPERPIKLVVPFTPGGTTDLLGRLLAEKLSTGLKQSVVVENRPGAGSMIGTGQVARSEPDGYTLLFATSSALVVSPAYTHAAYDPIKDFAPVILIASSPMALVASPNLKADSISELIALAKENPGTMNMASFGNGSVSHLTGELFKATTGADLLHVPYNGSAAALIDLQAERVDVMFDMISAAMPHYKTGKIRVLGTTGLKVSAAMPEVPAIAETIEGYESTAWFGIMAPAKTPDAIVQRLNIELSNALSSPDIKELLTQQSFEVIGGSPEEFSQVIETDLKKWRKVVKEAGIQP
jgi:tripartite-type tricarboxylate transporter receptor subunit TctC